jgi:DNA-directed RNA polymerase specialized sigma subunit
VEIEEKPVETPQLDPYEQWRIEPTPENLNRAVEQMGPKLNYHLHRYGLGNDPLAKDQARVFAAKAIQSYNPDSGASLMTWVDRNMQPLGRFRRLRATAVKVPEKIQLDAWKLERARTDFEEEHGREPELDELSDYAGMPLARIDAIRRNFRKMPSEEAFEANLEGQYAVDHIPEALEIIWDEGDAVDRKIIEMKTGFGGKYKPMKPKDIAEQLRISPVNLSRRSARLALKLDEIMEALDA